MKQNIKSRQAKQAQFATKTRRKAEARRRLPLVVALAVVAMIGLGLGIWAVAGASPRAQSAVALPTAALPAAALPASGASSPSVAPAAAPLELAPAPVAATTGHDPYPLVTAVEGEIRLATSLFADGQARHFTYLHEGAPIEFFVLQSQDGVARAAYNACDVCFEAKRGYQQEGDVMVCMNCGRRFPSDQINLVQGGCNPAPLERSVEGDMLVLQVSDVILGARFF